jgi:hypothetical protein
LPPADAAEATSWHPKIRELHAYWPSIHPPDRRLPSRQQFNPLAVTSLLPNIWLLDVIREPLRLRYRLIGTRIVDPQGGERTGQWLHEAPPEFAPNAPRFFHYTQVVQSGKPSWRRGKPFLMSYVERCAELGRIFLPLAGDGTTVDMILAITLMFDADGREMT